MHITPHNTYEEALHEHRLATLQQRRNELSNILFKEIQNSSHRLNSLLPLQHIPGNQLRHSKEYVVIRRNALIILIILIVFLLCICLLRFSQIVLCVMQLYPNGSIYSTMY